MRWVVDVDAATLLPPLGPGNGWESAALIGAGYPSLVMTTLLLFCSLHYPCIQPRSAIDTSNDILSTPSSSNNSCPPSPRGRTLDTELKLLLSPVSRDTPTGTIRGFSVRLAHEGGEAVVSDDKIGIVEHERFKSVKAP